MLEFFETAKTDFLATFEGAWIFPILLAAIIWILIREKDWIRKILLGYCRWLFCSCTGARCRGFCLSDCWETKFTGEFFG